MGWFPEQAGGLNRYYYDCSHYLPQAGVQMHGLVAGSTAVLSNSGGQIEPFATIDSSLLHRWRGIRQAVNRLLVKAEYPLIVSHFGLYTFPLLDKLGERPLVMHFHGPWALESGLEKRNRIGNWFKKALEQTVYRRAVSFIVLSEAFRNILHQEYRVPLERIHVIPGGVDITRFNPSLSRYQAREQLGWSQNRPLLLTVRRLTQRMGIENLILAIDTVRKTYPDVLLLIAGKGNLSASLQAQIADIGLTENVRLLGFVPDEQLALAYRAVDFSVVPTVALEGFGLIVVESLAAGTPVLGTPVGGIPEILRPFSQDLVFEGSATEQIAQGIIEVLSSQRKLPSSQDCQAYVQAHYDWSVVGKKIKSVYKSALEGVNQ